ncbi:PREDICTED: lymphocyte-specific protein 1-like isoform X2 [Cyprinodon variegatus]|uniref:Lymphocyte-specific protein 1-like n=1 Tax=Cyprinodon variegatus TaxID=28743 RepID=A0A3Q2CJ69_CYPVA|nr:PREDICTED: lymphocyte-specific protein 1-like isoform X2 [Cyprinodon variegatus]
MSESIKRRNSSKQLLQNLIRVTAQRSQEDAEEIERERRRKAREKQREEGILCFPEPQQHENITHNTESDEELKPSYFVLEEDEGFSDWSQRLENRNEQDALDNFRTKEVKPTAASVPGDYKHEHDEEEGKGEHGGRETEEASTQRSETIFSSKTPARTSYSSSVFLSQDTRQHLAAGHSADRTSYLAAGTMKTRNLDQCGGPSRLEEEQMRKDEDNEENVKLTLQMERQSSNEKVQEQKELICTVEEKEEIRKEQAHWAAEKEQEEYYALKNKRCEESQRRWSEEMSSGLAGFSDGEEPLNCYGPMSPTFKKLLVQFYPDEVNSRVSPDGKCKITERTESLRRSTSTIKKTLPPISVSKIDKRLEEYTHALEVASKEGRSSCQVLADLTSPSEPVASKKNLFEAGEAWNQNVISVTPCKDADGLKVGVADLINQWVKGGEDGSRSSSPSKPAEIRPGGVLNKKNLWEGLSDALTSTKDGKENSTKRYKYVVTGHGKYAKVPGHGCNEDLNCQAAGQFNEEL